MPYPTAAAGKPAYPMKRHTDMTQDWKQKGYIGEPAPEGTDLAAEIRRMCGEKNAVIMAHYYTDGSIQDVADFIGDSLALARKAASTSADIIVMCGVHFMAETCKLLCPEKTVLCPDLNAGCSLADSCRAADLERLKAEHPDHIVVSYVNTTAEVKALTDVVVTSGNAVSVVASLPEGAKIIFGPDRNLGRYVSSVTGREMLLWDGGCHVHARFSAEAIRRMKAANAGAAVLAHPECSAEVLAEADVIGSTAVLLDHVTANPRGTFIVATEAGILHEMRRRCPDAVLLPVPPEGSDGCNQCEYMRMNTLLKLYNTLKYGWPEISIPAGIAEKAVKPIERMVK